MMNIFYPLIILLLTNLMYSLIISQDTDLPLSGSLSEISPRISVVRPLSSASSVEMLEMMCEMQNGHRPDNKLYKSQNNLTKNNFLAVTGGDHHKSFKNLNNVVNRGVSKERSEEAEEELKKKSAPDVLTVLV